MATRPTPLKPILIAAGVLLVIALATFGFIIPLVAVILVLVVLGGGALLYRAGGPPER